jgi:hypothetical protein
VNPALELIARLHIDAQQHLGVLRSAILRALPEEHSRFVRIDRHLIGVIRNQVGFTRQPWHPETVVCICRQQCQECGTRMRRIAYRHVKFIGCEYVQLRIATTKIAATVNRTKIESPKIDSAGVDTGAKMLVGLIGNGVYPRCVLTSSRFPSGALRAPEPSRLKLKSVGATPPASDNF